MRSISTLLRPYSELLPPPNFVYGVLRLVASVTSPRRAAFYLATAFITATSLSPSSSMHVLVFTYIHVEQSMITVLWPSQSSM